MLGSAIPSPNKYEVLLLLVQMDRETALEDVRAFLGSGDPLLRLAALEAIGEYEMRECLPEVEKLLDTEENEDVRQCALDVLERLGVGE
jgi:HEAT repeat protein